MHSIVPQVKKAKSINEAQDLKKVNQGISQQKQLVSCNAGTEEEKTVAAPLGTSMQQPVEEVLLLLLLPRSAQASLADGEIWFMPIKTKSAYVLCVAVSFPTSYRIASG